MFRAIQGVNILEEKLDSIQALSLINGCSDDYTFVPTTKITPKLNQAVEMQSSIVTMSFIIAGGIGLLIVILAIVYKTREKIAKVKFTSINERD